ncbi:MAG TPA: hypothetical protein VGR22_08720 [Thermomicrobiales bacterium]|nr:hypothetical protein [Thermomicrobiales bacterium]
MTFTPQITTDTLTVPAELVPHEEGAEPIRATIWLSLTQNDLIRRGVGRG